MRMDHKKLQKLHNVLLMMIKQSYLDQGEYSMAPTRYMIAYVIAMRQYKALNKEDRDSCCGDRTVKTEEEEDKSWRI